jgi:hypothetical protein
VLTNLVSLEARFNQLKHLTLPPPLPQLKFLYLSRNRLTSLELPQGMTNLLEITLDGNQLTNFSLPPNLYSLTTLDLEDNQLTSLTLPAALTNLFYFFVSGSPITTIILPEQLAASNLAQLVAVLQNQGASIFTYPPTAQLLRPRQLTGAFQFGITGPPGIYSILASSDLANWQQVGVASNMLGSVSFVDATSHLSPRRFYRALVPNQ